MSDSQQTQPGVETPDSNSESDPEIAALLDFEPVPRKIAQPGAWTPELQRQFIARIAVHGSPGKASEELGKDRGGARKLYRAPEAKGFRAAWDAAIELAERRRADEFEPVPAGLNPPTFDSRKRSRPAIFVPQPGQMLNEFGEWEDEDSIRARAENAKDSIANKLLRCRRLYLQEISGNPGKRAAFEMLTELPIDWEKAAHLEPQPDEPWRRPNAHQPDMILTAENGWSFGECGYGPDKKAEVREAMDAYRAEKGLPPIEWENGW